MRDAGHAFPIIMLTAKDGDNDKINGLVLGADDYMVKPFNPMELMARVNAQLRRVSKYAIPQHEEPIIDIDGLAINPEAHTCKLYGKEVELTPTEFSIQLQLVKNQGKVISSEQIFEAVWGECICRSCARSWGIPAKRKSSSRRCGEWGIKLKAKYRIVNFSAFLRLLLVGSLSIAGTYFLILGNEQQH